MTWPPSAQIHATSRHSTECIMLWWTSILFMIAATAWFMCCNNCCLISSLPVWYNLDFTQHHKNVQWGQALWPSWQCNWSTLSCPLSLIICFQVLCNFSAEMWRQSYHVVSTCVFLYEEEYFLNWSVIHSPENVCKKQLSNVPRWKAEHKDYCALFNTAHLPKIFTEIYFALPQVDCCTILRIPSQWKWVYLWIKCNQAVVVLPTIHKIVHVWQSPGKVVALFGCGRGKDNHHANSSIPMIMEYQSPQRLCVHL
jgi:hypothetical protein